MHVYLCDGGQQLDNDLRGLFQPEPFNGFSMGFMYQDKDRDCKTNIFPHNFTSLESSMEVLLFCVFFGGKDKTLNALYPSLPVQLLEMLSL